MQPFNYGWEFCLPYVYWHHCWDFVILGRSLKWNYRVVILYTHCMTVGAWLTLLGINVVNTDVVLFFFLSGLKCQNGWCFDWQVQMCGIEFDLKEKEDFLETIILILLFMLCFGFVQCPWARVFVCHEQLITIPLPKLIKGAWASAYLLAWHDWLFYDCLATSMFLS